MKLSGVIFVKILRFAQDDRKDAQDDRKDAQDDKRGTKSPDGNAIM
jgi:hypothetical protein